VAATINVKTGGCRWISASGIQVLLRGQANTRATAPAKLLQSTAIFLPTAGLGLAVGYGLEQAQVCEYVHHRFFSLIPETVPDKTTWFWIANFILNTGDDLDTKTAYGARSIARPR